MSLDLLYLLPLWLDFDPFSAGHNQLPVVFMASAV
jgi:hypothetical protein